MSDTDTIVPTEAGKLAAELLPHVNELERLIADAQTCYEATKKSLELMVEAARPFAEAFINAPEVNLATAHWRQLAGAVERYDRAVKAAAQRSGKK